MSNMSDGEVDVQVESGELDILKAIEVVLRKADDLARGLRECVKALDRQDALLCLLAEDCDHAEYTRLIEALASSRKIPLLKVPSKNDLGLWSGLAKRINKTTNEPKKVVNASCVVIKKYGESNAELDFLLAHLKSL